MPTLIRLIVVLLVLVGIALGAMFALIATVTPRDKQVTIRIPARDLVPSATNDPLVRREIDTSSRPVAPAETPVVETPAVPAETPEAPAEGGGEVVTRQQGIE